jgi:antitoxin YefM
MRSKSLVMPIKEARARLTRLPEELADEAEPLMVTRNGKPALAIMPWELWESFEETMDIMADPQAMTQIRRALRNVERGKTVPWEQVKAELEPARNR